MVIDSHSFSNEILDKKVSANDVEEKNLKKRILDNRKHGKVSDFLKQSIQMGSKLSIVSAYFTIYAYYYLRKELDKIDNLRFIFGEPTFIKENTEKIFKEFEIFRREREHSIEGTESEIQLKNKMIQRNVSLRCAEWIKKKVEIRSVKKPDFCHAKLYLIDNEEDKDAVTGSSNFTAAGLGFKSNPNIELNLQSCSNQTFLELKEWFEDLWNNEDLIEDVKEQVLKRLEVLFEDNSPEFIYYLTLYHIFKDSIEDALNNDDEKKQLGLLDSKIWNSLYDFQKDGVRGAISKIEKYNGCIIADSVGLGKTYEALGIIKYYELKNMRALVLCPKKLRDNWILYKSNDIRNNLMEDRFSYDVLNHSDLLRKFGKSGDIDLKHLNWGNYNLLVVDESHNFRNNPPRKDRLTRYQKLMKDIIKHGVKTKVLMLSATPLNNKMNDLKNQIAFITEERDNAFYESANLESIEKTLSNANRIYKKWSELTDELRTTDNLLKMMNFDYFKLLNTISIARSRKHIKKYYDINAIGNFPKRLKPLSIKPKIDIQEEFPPFKEINLMIKKLNLAIYTPLKYVDKNKRYYSEKYDYTVNGASRFYQFDREMSLIDLIRVNVLKRLESSINSFSKTIKRMLDKSKDLLQRVENHSREINMNERINEIEDDEEILTDTTIGEKIKVFLDDVDKIKIKQELNEDIEKLQYLYDKSREISSDRDQKLKELKEAIKNKIKNPINPENKKIIIFTAFVDTAKYIYENISGWAHKNFNVFSALVVGSDENKTNLPEVSKNLNDILTEFSPISKQRHILKGIEEPQIDILICSDCISEGQNLQDCDCLINYDIHWNPVRIIQRFGRIDRIGSKNKQIKMINFWPDMKLEEYIKLEQRVKNRMSMTDLSAAGGENPFDKNDERELQYRKKQLEMLQNAILDLEDVSGTMSLTDLTFNEFIADTVNYIKNHPDKIQDSPSGLFSIVPRVDFRNGLEEGVIFCLKLKKDKYKIKDSNPLDPYFLVYISKDDEVKATYLEPKKILDIYKALCKDKKQVFKDLCRIFDKETSNSSKMDKYTNLLNKAIESITEIKRQNSIKSLFKKGKSYADRKSTFVIDDFELITFLIIKEKEW